eukprot:tig00001042_g6593.t2
MHLQGDVDVDRGRGRGRVLIDVIKLEDTDDEAQDLEAHSCRHMAAAAAAGCVKIEEEETEEDDSNVGSEAEAEELEAEEAALQMPASPELEVTGGEVELELGGGEVPAQSCSHNTPTVASRSRKTCVDKLGNTLPPCIRHTGRFYYFDHGWRGSRIYIPLNCAVENVSRERDRLLICLYGPAEATPRLTRPIEEYASERFYKEMFESAAPPKIGVHDSEPQMPATRDRLVEYLRSVGALERRADMNGPIKRLQPADREGEGAVPENVVLAEGVDLPASVTADRGRKDGRRRFRVQVRWSSSNFTAVLRPGVRLFTARRVRDAILIAIFGPEEASRRGLCYRLEEYREQPFYSALFGAGEAPRVGVHDPAPGTPEACHRLRSFLVNCGVEIVSSASKRLDASPDGPDDGEEWEEDEHVQASPAQGQAEAGQASSEETCGVNANSNADCETLSCEGERSAKRARRGQEGHWMHSRPEVVKLDATDSESDEAGCDAGGVPASNERKDAEEEDEKNPEYVETKKARTGTCRKNRAPRIRNLHKSKAMGNSRCVDVDEQGGRLPPWVYRKKRLYFFNRAWRGLMIYVPFNCTVENMSRERDRLLICLCGPAEAAAQLSHPIQEFASERFYKEMFESADPPKVGVHDPEPRMPATRDRLVEYLRSVGALERSAGAPPQALKETSDGEGSEAWLRGPLPHWLVSPDGVDHLDLEWGGAPFRAALGHGTDPQVFMQCRDRALLAMHGPAAAPQHCLLSCAAAEYAEEPFYRALFGPGPAPGVGLRDQEPGTRAARRRLRAFLRSLGALPPLPRPQEASPAELPVHEEVSDAHHVSFLWGSVEVRVPVREGLEDGAALAQARDRVALALFGPAAADRPGLSRPLQEYEGEPFYRELFGGEGPPRVGVHDPEPGTPAARARLVEWLAARCDCFGPSSGARRPEGPARRPEPDGDVPENVFLEESDELPANVYCRVSQDGDGSSQFRFGVQLMWGATNFSAALRPGVRLYTACCVRDAVLIALFGPEKASRRGLCNPLEEYQEQPFYRALFGPGEAPRVGVHDPAPGSREACHRLRSFLVNCGFEISLSDRKRLRTSPDGLAKPDSEELENMPLRDLKGGNLPANVVSQVKLKAGGGLPRIEVKFKWGGMTLCIGLRPDVCLFTARRVRDAVLIALCGPEEASRRGLCYRLEEYREQPFYRALFGPGEAPRVGVHDPAPGTPEACHRLRSFLAGCGLDIISSRRKRLGASPDGPIVAGRHDEQAAAPAKAAPDKPEDSERSELRTEEAAAGEARLSTTAAPVSRPASTQIAPPEWGPPLPAAPSLPATAEHDLSQAPPEVETTVVALQEPSRILDPAAKEWAGGTSEAPTSTAPAAPTGPVRHAPAARNALATSAAQHAPTAPAAPAPTCTAPAAPAPRLSVQEASKSAAAAAAAATQNAPAAPQHAAQAQYAAPAQGTVNCGPSMQPGSYGYGAASLGSAPALQPFDFVQPFTGISSYSAPFGAGGAAPTYSAQSAGAPSFFYGAEASSCGAGVGAAPYGASNLGYAYANYPMQAVAHAQRAAPSAPYSVGGAGYGFVQQMSTPSWPPQAAPMPSQATSFHGQQTAWQPAVAAAASAGSGATFAQQTRSWLSQAGASRATVGEGRARASASGATWRRSCERPPATSAPTSSRPAPPAPPRPAPPAPPRPARPAPPAPALTRAQLWDNDFNRVATAAEVAQAAAASPIFYVVDASGR